LSDWIAVGIIGIFTHVCDNGDSAWGNGDLSLGAIEHKHLGLSQHLLSARITVASVHSISASLEQFHDIILAIT
jgi:hypothetical protein